MGATSSSNEPTATPLQGSVLYVEDDPTNFALVQALLAVHPDLRLVQASSGHEGVDRARSERPNIVLLDMHLPDISGLEVVRLLSQDIAAEHFRVILLTGDKLNIDILKAMSLGAFEYLIKPVDIHVLEASIRRALTSKAASGSGRPPPRRP